MGIALKKLKPDQVDAMLRGNNITFNSKDIQCGRQFAFEDDAKLNVFDSGKRHWCGATDGDSVDVVNEILGDANASSSVIKSEGNTTAHSATNKVFIVYGHDSEARNQLELMLRRFKLEPIVLQNLPTGGQTVIEKLEATSDVRFAIVLLTPDDEGHRIGVPDEQKPRARQNVVLELGMFLAKLGRKRVAILHKGELELPSDINGLLYVPFQNAVDDVKDRVAAELQEAGFQINIKDLLS